MAALQQLDLSNNKIATIPPEFFQNSLGNLLLLNLANNQITSIPSRVKLLSNLRVLQLSQ